MKLRKAVLIIHGFTGSLYDNEFLMNYLELNHNYDVFAWTLPGHNKDRFSNAKYSDWIDFVDEKMNYLVDNGYTSIYVIGHSMGGVLASYLASKYSQVKKLVLVNAAFDYINLHQNKVDILDKRSFDKYNHLFEKVLRMSIFFIGEFAKLVKKYQYCLENIKCPILVLRSLEDEIIPFETGNMIFQSVFSRKKYLTDIENAPHIVLSSNRKEEVSIYIEKFLKCNFTWKKYYKKLI